MNAITLVRAAPTLERLGGRAHWFLRAALASVYIFHGTAKLPALEGTAAMLGLPVAVVLMVALAETAGGALILLGGFAQGAMRAWLTRVGVLMVTPVILGAIALVHWGQWTFVPSATHAMGGMEFQVTLLLMQLYLLLKPGS